MVTDLEMGDIYEYEAEATEIKWLDDSMMFAVRNKEIIAWDFDLYYIKFRTFRIANIVFVIISGQRNLHRCFTRLKFDQVTMIDSSANQLYALENQQLRKINTADESILCAFFRHHIIIVRTHLQNIRHNRQCFFRN